VNAPAVLWGGVDLWRPRVYLDYTLQPTNLQYRACRIELADLGLNFPLIKCILLPALVIITIPIPQSTINIQIHPLQNNIFMCPRSIAGVPLSQALLGYLSTAPQSVCVPDVIGTLAVWIQKQKQTNPPTQPTKTKPRVSHEASWLCVGGKGVD